MDRGQRREAAGAIAQLRVGLLRVATRGARKILSTIIVVPRCIATAA